MSLRLFLALIPDALEAEATLRLQRAIAWPAGAKLVRRENLHVTLHFLGEVDATRLEPLARAIAVTSPPVEIVLDRFAAWTPGIAVLEPAATPDALGALHARLAQALAGAGFALDARPYRPHVTLARAAQGATAPVVPEALRWRASRYALVQSIDGRYVPLRHHELDGKDAPRP
jgi:2'-5' RNA ligase